MSKRLRMSLGFSRILRQYLLFCTLSGLMGYSPWSFGEPVTTIRNNGDSANRIDLVILSEGYTSTEMEKFATDVENVVNGFFAQEPFKEYQGYFNVHRVDVTSLESGADHPEEAIPSSKMTAFDATYNCAGIERLICVDVSKVNTIVANSVRADQRDMVLVLVNDTKYGGSGGSIATASLHPEVIELVLHEIGHSFGLLADEYDFGICNNIVEPPQANVTRETDRNLIKWNTGGGPPSGWIDPGTPIPTNSISSGVPGLYEGAQYCTTGLYRPTFNSKMRSLGAPFEQVNEEQLIKRIYNWVSPLDSSSPLSSTVPVRIGYKQAFQISAPIPVTHSLLTTWYVDNTAVTTGPAFTFDSEAFGTGAHSVQVVVADSTPKVRNDPGNVLQDIRTWNVNVTEQAAVLRVPADYANLQEAIDVAASGDTVLVSPGTYAGGLIISGKTITLASEYINTGNASDVDQTIVTGGQPMLRIDATAVDTTIQGFTFQNGGQALVNSASHANILDNRFINTGDALSFERGGGVARGNYFDGAGDDGIDVDYPDYPLTLEQNTILNSSDDGIEIRLHPYTGPMVNIVIRNNYISGNREDGIQLIDYAGLSNRTFRIDRNVIVNNTDVGLGTMADGNTTENFAGSSMVEDVQVINNSFSGNPFGITGSSNMLVLNNIIANSAQSGLKQASGSSLASYNIFWNNGTDYTDSNVDVAASLFKDPRFDANYNLLPGSVCIDAGAASMLWNGQTVNAPAYNDLAPDLGAKERALLPTVTAVASDATAAETGADPGNFEIFRTGDTSIPLTVFFSLNGTAVNGADYEPLPELVTLPAGASSADLVVVPIDDADPEGDETAILALTSVPDYTVGNPASAVITLVDNDLLLPTVTISATDPIAFESGSDPGVFTISRTGDSNAPLTVNYTIGGNATEGVDYNTIGNSVTIPVGSDSVTVTIQPINDAIIDDEEVVLSLIAIEDFYTVGAPGSAAVTITDTGSAFTASFQNGVLPTSMYVGTTNTWISEMNADKNYGASNNVRIDGFDGNGMDRYGLIKWDVSSIPKGSLIQSVMITVDVTDAHIGSYELYEMKRPWIQSAATWNTYSLTASWDLAGAKGALDHGTEVLGTFDAADVGLHTVELNSAGLALVQAWVDNPALNNGFIVNNPENWNSLSFLSTNAKIPATRPKMTVTYVVAAQ